ncbi:hypothetical protein ABT010_37630 [Streptomyces sp. NPDC002668]|uniref:hypothetical protein n=1 Tax=Streptomyces sp. NPDC002668 TaxID=3154422 RepID=UPI0033198687
MKHSPEPPPVTERLSRALRDLSTVERWAEHTGTGRPPDSGTGNEEVAWESTEFRVDTMTRNGMHHVVDITYRRQDGEGPGGELAEAERAVLHSSVRALLDMAEHESGPAHTVVVPTAQGARVLSCRLGGTTVTAAGPETGPPAPASPSGPGQGPFPPVPGGW